MIDKGHMELGSIASLSKELTDRDCGFVEDMDREESEQAVIYPPQKSPQG